MHRVAKKIAKIVVGEAPDNPSRSPVGFRIAILADNIIVATGSRPDFGDTSNPRLVNSDVLLGLMACPGRLAIIGGGQFGCEFASIYRTLASGFDVAKALS